MCYICSGHLSVIVFVLLLIDPLQTPYCYEGCRGDALTLGMRLSTRCITSSTHWLIQVQSKNSGGDIEKKV